MKKTYKVISFFMVAIMLIAVATPVFATGAGSMTDLSVDYTITGNDKIKDIGSKVLSILTIIGIVVSVVVIAGLGIKYITGSAEEKADYKKSFVPLLVGMILLLGASSIANFLINAAS